MPATYNTPIAQPTAASITDIVLRSSAESPQISLSALELDSNGAPMANPASVLMTPAAFFAAMQAASGTWKQRLYTVFLAQLGQAATVI